MRSWARDNGDRIVVTETATSLKDFLLESFGIYQLFVDGKLVETELNNFPQRFYTVDEMRELVQRAGFVDVRIQKVFTEEEAHDSDAFVSVSCKRSG